MKKTLFKIILSLLFCTTTPCQAAKSMPDSLLNIEKAYAYILESTDVSLSIVKGMRMMATAPEWELSIVEGDINFYIGKFHEAVRCYEQALASPEVESNCQRQAKLWTRLMICHDVLLDELLLVDDIYHLRRHAEKCEHHVYLALADFVMGKRLHMHNEKEKGYRQCLESLEVIKNNDIEDKSMLLKQCYVTLAQMYERDQRHDEAIKAILSAEKLTKRPVSSKKINGQIDYWLHYVYGIKASMLASAGRMGEAELTYKRWKDYSRDFVFTDVEIIPFLLTSQRSEEALTLAQRYKNYLYQEGDSVEIRTLKALIYESIANSQMGRQDQALQSISSMSGLAIQLHEQKSKEEMTTRLQSLNEQEMLHNRNMWMLGLSIAMLALLLLAAILLWHFRNNYKNNQKLQRAMNRARAYQRAVMKADEESEKMQQLLQRDGVRLSENTAVTKVRADDDDTAVSGATAAETTGDTAATTISVDGDDDEMLFVLLDKQVTKRKLFLNPDLSREDLMRLIGVDKNHIGRIMSRYSEASNISTYINQKRAYYAAEYIKEHPEHTVAAVVKACGMSNAVTLNRTFKDLFGISPSTYRQKVIVGEAPENLLK